jgi:hypothetical protein
MVAAWQANVCCSHVQDTLPHREVQSHTCLVTLAQTRYPSEHFHRPSSHLPMSLPVNPFSRSSRAGDAWFCVGPASSYPNLDDSTRVAEQRMCRDKFTPGCRIFHVPREDSSKAVEVAIDDWKDPERGDSKDQVMVFRYNERFVAINHVRVSNTFCHHH